MDAGEGAVWFANTPLDGWTGTAWVSEVAWGDLHTYDRFVTDRTFGAKKRIFLAPEEKKLDYGTYPVVRTPDLKVWIVVSTNADIASRDSYEQSYILVNADYSADIVEMTTTTLSSGQEGDAVPVVIGSSVCDLDRLSRDSSDNFDTVDYGLYKMVFPSSVVIDTDKELVIDGVNYEVKEAYKELLTVVVRALRRSAL